jgi:predicted O-methyltransferase YrrM
MADATRWNRPRAFHFEHDERWTKVDHYNLSHLYPKGAYPDPELMAKVLKNSEEAGMPPIAVAPAHGKFLQIQARLLKARNILEIGMLGGYSTIWLATSHPDAKVTSVELDTEFAKVAKKHFELAGVSDQIEVVLGSALDELPRLVQEVKDGKRPKVDMVFIDANKDSNLEYFQHAVEMARPGACIIVDNVVRAGRVVDEDFADNPDVKGTRRLIEALANDNRIEATVLQTVAEKSYDGFLIAVVKDE